LFYKDPQGNNDALKDALGNKLVVIVGDGGESCEFVFARGLSMHKSDITMH